MHIDDKVLPHEQHVDPKEDCDHSWLYVPDWEGDPSIPNGTRDTSYWKCDLCDEQTFDRPDGIDDDYPGPEFEPDEPEGVDDASVDYEYDPLRLDP